MIENILYVFLGAFCGAISTYAIIKFTLNPTKIIEEITDFIVSDEEMQKKIFLLGNIIGNGIKSGVGLQPKAGKFKFEDLIGMAIANWFMPQQQTAQQIQQQQIPQPPPHYKKIFSGEA